ncbi:MAG: tetratricopeptide repeat protein [Candidatus Hodarchaeales archaeon]
MNPYEKFYQLQNSLMMIFDRIGLTQEIGDELTSEDLTQEEFDQIQFLLEQFEDILNEITSKDTTSKEIVDERLLIRIGNYYYSFVDDLDKTVEYYELALKIEENELAYFNSAIIYEKENELKKALDMLKEATYLKPDFTKAYYHQAKILDKMDHKEEAMSMLIKCHQLKPHDLEINSLLAEYYLAQGKKEEALNTLKLIKNKDETIIEKIELLEKKDSVTNKILGLFKRK